MQIILGTAQLSGNYGISNKNLTNRYNKSYLDKIYKTSKNNKINYLDTSENYPGVHKKIGSSKLNQLKIITKINLDKVFDKKKSQFRFDKILKDLNKDSIYALLIHNPVNLNNKNILSTINFIKNLKSENKVKKIGISIYDKKDLNIIKNFWVPDIVQLPLNIFNRNLIKDKTVNTLLKKNVEIHVRSIFLQGLLLSKQVPKKFIKFKPILKMWYSVTNNNLEKKISFSIKSINKFYNLKNFVIGFDDIEQINLLGKILKKIEKIPQNLKKIKTDSKILKDPRRWYKL